jgi:hypothetical protein
MRGRVWWGALHPFGSADCLLAVACRSMPAGAIVIVIVIIIGKKQAPSVRHRLGRRPPPMASRTLRCVAITFQAIQFRIGRRDSQTGNATHPRQGAHVPLIGLAQSRSPGLVICNQRIHHVMLSPNVAIVRCAVLMALIGRSHKRQGSSPPGACLWAARRDRRRGHVSTAAPTPFFRPPSSSKPRLSLSARPWSSPTERPVQWCVWLDEIHSLRISIRGHNGRWTVAPFKICTAGLKSDLGCTAGSAGCGRQEPKRSASSIRIRRRCPPIMTSGRCLCRCDLLVPPKRSPPTWVSLGSKRRPFCGIISTSCSPSHKR